MGTEEGEGRALRTIRTQWKLVLGQMCIEMMCPVLGCCAGGGWPAVPLMNTRPSREAATLIASQVLAVHFLPLPIPGCANESGGRMAGSSGRKRWVR